MKLMIKHKYFKQIAEGKKDMEFRDAHFTFVDESNNETITKSIINTALFDRAKVKELGKFTKKEMDELFDDKKILICKLGEYNAL